MGTRRSWTKRRATPAGWSVRSQLALIVLAVVAVFAVGGAVLAHQAAQRARRSGHENARYLAEVAADVVARNLALGAAQVSAIATGPQAARLLDTPSACDLHFDPSLYPGSRLDVVTIDGRVTCSSDRDPQRGASAGTAPWLHRLADGDGAFQSEPYLDEGAGGTVVAIVAPVVGPGGRTAGGVALVVATRAVADLLGHSYGGEMHYEFAVVDRDRGRVLSAPAHRTVDLGPAPAASHVFSRRSFITATAPIRGSRWAAVAAVDRDRALAPARSAFQGQLALAGAVLAMLLAAVTIVYRRIARPLRRLTASVGASGPAVTGRSIKGPREIAILADQLHAAGIDRAIYEEQLAHLSLHDPLTDLPNRALMLERVGQSVRQADRNGCTVGVLVVDVDRFELINDGLGHAAGDDVLVEVARRLTEGLPAGDTLARVGGDEFAVLHEAFPGDEPAEELAARLLRVLVPSIEVADTIVRVTVSIGVAVRRPGSSHRDLARHANAAMHAAKRRGGARVELFRDETHDGPTRRLALESELAAAIERRELYVLYQPKIDLVTGDPVGAEVLARWDHPALGAVSPATFVPIAEDTGLILPLGRFVLEEACRQAATWWHEGADVTVSVNVSGRQLTDPGLAADVEEILGRTGVPPTRICLELTESVLMGDTTQTIQTLDALHGLGVQLSIDDFGTGYSSLGYLRRFPVDELKIDRIFVQEMIDSADGRALVDAMIAMGRALGLSIVAEGVETLAQAAALRELGCDTAQGFLYSRPAPAEQISPLFVRHGARRR